MAPGAMPVNGMLPAMRQLIVNADDYGAAAGVNAGIVEAFQQGILTSTTVMATGDALDDGLARLRDAPALDTGCHLTLVDGRAASPPAAVRSLCDADGRFPATLAGLLPRLVAGALRQQEIVIEFRAQVERLLRAGLVLSHLDSHKHTHAHPRVLDAVLRVAEEFKIPYIRKPYENLSWTECRRLAARASHPRVIYKGWLSARLMNCFQSNFDRRLAASPIRCPDHFLGFSVTGQLRPALITAVIAAARPGVNELMCHPGRLDAELGALPTRLKHERECELGALISPDARDALGAHDIRLTSYRALGECHHAAVAAANSGGEMR